jgi:hypothetical protein
MQQSALQSQSQGKRMQRFLHLKHNEFDGGLSGKRA